ncbi:MAG: Na+/H+ antiporter NhaA [Chitinophagaceae bacterium]
MIINKFTNLFKEFYDSEKIAGLLLVVCTAISLLVSNSSFGEGYVHFMHQKINLSFSAIQLNYSVEHWINDGLMAIFFLLVGLEVERELYVGELASFKKAQLPIAAAVGGMVIPAIIHFVFNKGTVSQSGFAIPMATDIAFALGILALAGKKVPVAVKIFLTALAIIDDIGAIIIIAIFYTKTVLFAYLVAALSIFTFLLVLNRLRVKNLAFYLIPGVVMWYCVLQSGVHATIAGVLLAFAVPFHNDDQKNISYRLQHFLHRPVAFIILPLFALVNTAIILPKNIFESLSSTNSVGIMAGLLVGKLAGIFFFPYLLIKAGLASFTKELDLKYLLGIGLLGGIGFTMSIFISNLAFEDPNMITSSKVSIIIASTIAAIGGLLIFILRKPVKNGEHLLS